MPLNQAELEELTRLIAVEVPALMLAQVVKEQNVVTDFDMRAKGGPEKAGERNHLLVAGVLATYDQAGIVHRFLTRLYERMDWNPLFVAAITPYCIPDDASKDARQAFLSRRDNLLVSEVLQRYGAEFEPRVCCIAGRIEVVAGDPPEFASGTGVLVGPDLVLTTMHLFDPVMNADKTREVPDRFAVFFDHVHGEPIRDPNRAGITARRVKLHADWLVESRPSVLEDGTFEHPTPGEIQQLQTGLDFALIRLAEKIGLQTIDSAGGRVRLWVDPPAVNVPAKLDAESRILITQHPFGYARLVDLGRFMGYCDSQTRIRYTTNTEEGSSGAPCFNKDLALVGIHNAEYRPNHIRRPNSNQAIRFDHIQTLIAPHLTRQTSQTPRTSRIWNVAVSPGSVRVVLGRTSFIDWIDRAALETTTARSDRLYAAVSSYSGAGKTFSIEILRASRRDSGEPMVVIGNSQESFPATVEDVVNVIVDQLRLPPEDLRLFPVRPSSSLPGGAIDGDKLGKWPSEVVPKWLADVLEKHREREVDRRDAARKIVTEYENLNKPVPADIRELADSQAASMIKPYQWPIVWIVLDRLDKTGMSQEVKDFLGGLIGTSMDDAALSPSLRRLRWLFLGYRPDFVRDGDMVVEALDPAGFKTAAVEDCVRSVYAARGEELQKGFLDGIAVAIDAFEKAPVVGAEVTRPDRRLEILQDIASRIIADHMR